MNGKWSKEEKDFIVENAPIMTDDVLVDALNDRFKTERKHATVRKMRQRLKIKKAHGRGICRVETEE